MNVRKLPSNSSVGVPGIGQEPPLADGRFEASQLIEWTSLLDRVFDIDMQLWPNCGGGVFKIVAAILALPVSEKILSHLGLDP